MLRNTDTATHVVLVCQTANCTILGVSACEHGNMHCQLHNPWLQCEKSKVMATWHWQPQQHALPYESSIAVWSWWNCAKIGQCNASTKGPCASAAQLPICLLSPQSHSALCLTRQALCDLSVTLLKSVHECLMVVVLGGFRQHSAAYTPQHRALVTPLLVPQLKSLCLW